MRQAIRRSLEVKGFEATVFDSAEALLAAGVASMAKCLVLDIHLPGMSGFDLQRHLAAAGTAIPIVFITARDLPAFRGQALASANGYLVKPFSSDELVEAVTRAIKE